MFDLVIDTSYKYLYIALVKDGKVYSERMQEGNNNHSEMLTDCLKNLLKDSKASIGEVKRILVCKGPGSYTGLRVAGTVAKVLAHAERIPLWTFSSLDLLLSSYLDQDGFYVAYMDARRGGAFAKTVRIIKGNFETVQDDIYIPFSDLQNLYPDAIYINAVNPQYDIPKLIEKGLIEEVKDVHSFVPNYLRSGV